MDKKELGVKRPCIIPIPPSLKHLASKLLPDFDKKKKQTASTLNPVKSPPFWLFPWFQGYPNKDRRVWYACWQLCPPLCPSRHILSSSQSRDIVDQHIKDQPWSMLATSTRQIKTIASVRVRKKTYFKFPGEAGVDPGFQKRGFDGILPRKILKGQ